jgi:hypothetical protein
MKYKLSFIAILLIHSISAFNASAESKKEYRVQIDAIPKTIDEYISMRDRIAVTPEGGAAMLLVALKMYEINKDEGFKALIAIMDLSILRKQKGGKEYRGYGFGGSYSDMFQSVYSRFPYIASSYFPGATPANSYATGDGPFQFEFKLHKYRTQDDIEHTFFIPCGGADSPRPVHMKKNDKGIWKAANYSSLLVGIRPAANTKKTDKDEI